MSKLDITHSITNKTGLEAKTVGLIVHLTLNSIIRALETAGHLELRDFGVFTVYVSKPRTCRNPKTGGKVHVPSRRKVKFKAGGRMRARMNDIVSQE